MNTVCDCDYQAPTFTNDGLWNMFDFSIVITGWLDIANISGKVSFLRTLRLLRTFKLFGRNKRLFAMLQGLTEGLRASFSIILLWLVLWFLFCFIGVAAFGRNNPFSFGSLDAAFMSLYIVSTMDWANIYNVDQYGCNRHDGNDIYTQCNTTSKVCPDLKHLVNEWSSQTGHNWDQYGQTDWSTTPSADVQQLQLRRYCYSPLDMNGVKSISTMSSLVPALYYAAFILLVALILMTLFMGSVSMSMVTVMASLVKAEKRKSKQVKLQKMRENYHLLASGTQTCPNELNFEFSVNARVAFACEDIVRKRFLERTYQAGYVRALPTTHYYYFYY